MTGAGTWSMSSWRHSGSGEPRPFEPGGRTSDGGPPWADRSRLAVEERAKRLPPFDTERNRTTAGDST